MGLEKKNILGISSGCAKTGWTKHIIHCEFEVYVNTVFLHHSQSLNIDLKNFPTKNVEIDWFSELSLEGHCQLSQEISTGITVLLTIHWILPANIRLARSRKEEEQ